MMERYHITFHGPARGAIPLMSVTTASKYPDTRTVALRGVGALVVAVLANGILLTVVLQTNAVQRFQPLNYTSVIVLTSVGLLGATVVYWLLVQWKRDPDRYFAWIAIIVLVVSFIPDVGLLYVDPQATIAGVVVLMAMHAIAAGVAIGVLTELGR